MWDWGVLVTGVVGVLGLLGVIYTQRRADAREDKRIAREDADRFYEHRRTAYLALLKELRRYEYAFVTADEHPDQYPEPWDPEYSDLSDLWDLVEDVEVHGTKAGRTAAAAAAVAVLGGSAQHLDERLQAYRAQIREDLGIKDELPS